MSFSALTHEEVLGMRQHFERDLAVPNTAVRAQIEADVQAFLARGGVIEQAEQKQLRCVASDWDKNGGTLRRKWVDGPAEFSFTNFRMRGKAA